MKSISDDEMDILKKRVNEMTDEELELLVNLSIEHLQIDRETLDK